MLDEYKRLLIISDALEVLVETLCPPDKVAEHKAYSESILNAGGPTTIAHCTCYTIAGDSLNCPVHH